MIVLRSSGDEVKYDDFDIENECFTLLNALLCKCHVMYITHFIPHEDGTVLLKAKDKAYAPKGLKRCLINGYMLFSD